MDRKISFAILTIFILVPGVLAFFYLSPPSSPPIPQPADGKEEVKKPPPPPSPVPLPADEKADEVVLIKHERKLSLKKNGKILKTYIVALGFEPKGPKTCLGDGRTPEGRYILDWKNSQSRFHLSIHLSYPGPADRSRAAKAGCSPGGNIMIHGLPNGWDGIAESHRLHDWTLGCIAVTSEEIEEIWRVVPVGTPIEILP